MRRAGPCAKLTKQGYFSENPAQNQRGSNPGRMHDWRGSQALQQLRHVPLSNTMCLIRWDWTAYNFTKHI